MASEGCVVGGRYRLDSVLGAGGMGVVWRAFDERLARWVAIKEIRFTDTLTREEREELKERAMLEALSASRLVHRNVVAVYDVVDDGDRPWVVMRLVEGRSLRQIVTADGPLDPVAAARLGLGLLDALDAAHAAGVVHRDVKPSNVLVLPDGRPLLTDFSIATLGGARPPIRGGGVLGSPGYVAPERLHGEEGGVPADMFGLGATLYYAVEGTGPFARGDVLACLIATVCEPHPRPLRAGPLAPVIDALLAKDEADRADSPAARAALAAAARPRHKPARRVPLTARRAYTTAPVTSPTPSTRAPRRRRIAALSASAAVLLPVAAMIAAAGGGPSGALDRQDAAVRQPAPPQVGPSTPPPGGRRALGLPDVLSPTVEEERAEAPARGVTTEPVSDHTSPNPSGGGGGQTGSGTPSPPAGEVTGLDVTVTADGDACTFSASATVTVSGPTTVTYRVSWTDGAPTVHSVQFGAAGSAALTVPAGVAHGAGGVWVQVEVLEPTAASDRGEATLPDRCSPTSPTPILTPDSSQNNESGVTPTGVTPAAGA